MLGLYQVTIDAIKNFNFLLLLPLAIGVIGGTLATTRVLENAMNNHTRGNLSSDHWLCTGFSTGDIPGLPCRMELVDMPHHFGGRVLFHLSDVQIW